MSAAVASSASGAGSREIPVLSGALPLLGHLLELRRRPIDLFRRALAECGEVAELRFARTPVVLLSGVEAQEAFFRAPEEQLDQAAAYPFMTPVFGRGVVFDGTPEQRRQGMKNQALKAGAMAGHAERIASESRRMLDGLPEAGEIDLLDFFSELTLYTSSACLIGPEFREELPREVFRLFYELEKGTDAIAYVNPDLPLPVFRRRDRARAQLVTLLDGIFRRRQARRGAQGPRELFDVLLSLRDANGAPRYGIDQVTGMFISMMFAGHHTTSGTAAWALIELMRHPRWMKAVVDEIDAQPPGDSAGARAMAAMPILEAALKETLRLHPPLILLMRYVVHDFHHGPYTVPAGQRVGVSPAVSNRLPEHFAEPDRYDPERYLDGRDEDRQPMAWIPFGGGRHRCVGAPFAMMQLKAIFGVLLRELQLEMAQPEASYRDDHSKMVVQLAQPCRARHRLRRS